MYLVVRREHHPFSVCLRGGEYVKITVCDVVAVRRVPNYFPPKLCDKFLRLISCWFHCLIWVQRTSTSLLVTDVCATGKKLAAPLTNVYYIHRSSTVNFNQLAMNVNRCHLFSVKSRMTNRNLYLNGDARGAPSQTAAMPRLSGRYYFAVIRVVVRGTGCCRIEPSASCGDATT